MSISPENKSFQLHENKEHTSFVQRLKARLQQKIQELRGKNEETQVSPEQIAQQLFFECVKQSLTPEGLTAITSFQPPHNTFDIAKLDSETVFRLRYENKRIFELLPEPIVMVEHLYFCVIKNGENNKVFTPENLKVSNGMGMLFDDIYNVSTLEESNPGQIEVKEVVIGNSLVDWNDLNATFPAKTFAFGESSSVKVKMEIFPEKIEIVSGGKTVKEKVKEPITLAGGVQRAPARQLG
jgi:hypothetical protein